MFWRQWDLSSKRIGEVQRAIIWEGRMREAEWPEVEPEIGRLEGREGEAKWRMGG